MRLIDADAIHWKGFPNDFGEFHPDYVEKCDVDKMPTIDAAPVVRCKDCVIHGSCLTEDTFRIARIENPFCCGGKRKDPTLAEPSENVI